MRYLSVIFCVYAFSFIYDLFTMIKIDINDYVSIDIQIYNYR